MIKLERLITKPVLEPKKEDLWQSSAVFNPAAIYYRGLIHLLYRATDLPPHEKYGRYISRIGYAVSVDGINFYRFDKPVMEAVCDQERRGIEDPRIVKIEDTFYMTYTGFGNRFEGDYRIMLARSHNLITWERMGVMLDEPDKDAALFPRKVNGRYVMFHRRYPNIWLAFSENLKEWVDHIELVKTRPNSWESARVGVAGPPIEHKYGYIVIYHAADSHNVYRLGIFLLDKSNPTKILSRQSEPILEPELDWEINGYVPNVVFSCGQVEWGDDILVYYGGADTAIGVAKLNLNNIKFD